MNTRVVRIQNIDEARCNQFFLDVDNNANQITQYTVVHRLLIISIVLAPMTSLRIWKAGPAEVLCLLACILHLTRRGRERGFNSQLICFWSAFLLASALGTVYGWAFYSSETTPSQLLTWIYFAVVSVVSYDAFRMATSDSLKNALKALSLMGCSWYLLLYLYSRLVRSSILGAPLWYEGTRFSGGGSNPHQLALFLSIIGVIQFAFMLNEHRLLNKVTLLLAFIISMLLLMETKSSTGIMSSVVGLTIIMLFTFHDSRTRIVLVSLLLMLACLLMSPLIDSMMRWIASDANGMGRLEIFSSFPSAFMKSPIVGLGPGIHAQNGIIEFHNTYLELLSMSGMLGGAAFLVLTVQLYSALKVNQLAISCLFTLYAFGLSGFAMRRLVYWLILSLVMAYVNAQSLAVTVDSWCR